MPEIVVTEVMRSLMEDIPGARLLVFEAQDA